MDPSVIFYQLASVIALGVALVAAVNLFWGTDIALAQSDAETKLKELANHIDDIACQGETIRSGFLPPESFRVSAYDFSTYDALQVQGANELQASTPASGEEASVETECGQVIICDPGVPIESCHSDHNIRMNDPGQVSFSFRYNPSGHDNGLVLLQQQAQIEEDGPFLIYLNESESFDTDPSIKGASVTTGQLFDFFKISVPEDSPPEDPEIWFKGDIAGKTGDIGQGHSNSVLIGNESELYRVDLAEPGSESAAFPINDSEYNIQDIGGLGDIMDSTSPTDSVVIDEHGAPDDWTNRFSICAINFGEGSSQCTDITDSLGLEGYDVDPRVGAIVNAGNGPEATMIQSGDSSDAQPYLYLWDGESFRNKTITPFRTCEDQSIYDPEEHTAWNVTVYDIGGTVNADYGYGYDDQDLAAIIENEDGEQQLGYIKLHGDCAFTAEPITGTKQPGSSYDDMRVGYPGEDRIPYMLDDYDGELRYYHLLQQEDYIVNNTDGETVHANSVSSIIPELVP